MKQDIPELSVVVPVHDESRNVVALLDEIEAALSATAITGNTRAPCA